VGCPPAEQPELVVIVPDRRDETILQCALARHRGRPGALAHTDIVTVSGDGWPYAVSVFLNRGSLAFTAADIAVGPPYAPTDVTAADVNRDGRVDLLVSVGSANSLHVTGEGAMFMLLGNGNGTFDPATAYALPPGPMQIVAGDFNRDGLIDVVTGNRSAIVQEDCYIPVKTWDSVSVLVGLGDGTFAGPWNFSIGDQSVTDPWWDPVSTRFSNTLFSLNTNDLNHDGATDLIASHGAVLLNIPAVANRAPTVDAGPDAVIESPWPPEEFSVVRANDADDDVLTWEIHDGTGRVIATYPNACGLPLDPGTNTYTVTVDDGHGHRATDTVVYTRVIYGRLFQDGADVGAVRAAGSDSYDPTTDTYTVSGSGADIWGSADEFHFLWLNVRGNFRITALVNSVESVNLWAKGGIMIRENLNPAARHASLFATPSKGVAFQRRTVENGTSIHTAGPATTAPVWVKLERTGDEIAAYSRTSSTDAWTLIGGQTLVNFAFDAVAGLAVTSHVDGTVATASFLRVQIEHMSPLTGSAIGAGTGSMTADGAAFKVDGHGADIWGTAGHPRRRDARRNPTMRRVQWSITTSTQWV
jgi:VCBS repeat protein